VRAVIADGATVTQVAARFGVSRQTVHAWLAKYEAGGLEGLGDRSHRPVGCPHQMPAEAEVEIARLQSAAGRPIDVWVTDHVLQFYDGDQLLRTQKRTSEGSVRVKRSTAPKRAR
jgi:transposase